MNNLNPTDIRWHRKSRVLEVAFPNGQRFRLPAEYLRVFSPSAEVQGHGPDQAKLVAGKRLVTIARLEPVGRYALRLVFDDGHDSGLYTWQYLYELGQNYPKNWNRYLERLRKAGLRREPDDVTIIKLD
jgi:DUF971 family protein